MYNKGAIDQMEKRGIVKRFLAVVLLVTAVIGLTIALPGMSVFAEALQPEEQGETAESQSESYEETSEEDGLDEQTETDETEVSETQTEPGEEESVSQNDISEKEAEEQGESIELFADESTLADDEIELTSAILRKCIVKGTNPSGVTVNLFDYSQGRASDGSTEVAHDYFYQEEWDEALQDYAKKGVVTTYNLGISAGHLLRFGYRDDECDYCKIYGYGDWNEYHTNRYHGIVQNKLYNGFPRLNLSEVTEVGEYSGDYLTKNKRTESLAYLFSPNSTAYKEAYSDVQGLFRQDADGYYYYDSQLNFASFNKGTNSFNLYNSPAVAKRADSNIYYGQFFPFNGARDVFDAAYLDENNIMRLTYNNTAGREDGTNENNFDPITVGGQSFIKCYAPTLNHYLGLTLQMRFVQPEGGCVTGSTGESKDMIFSFSGDDDVWIFIDDVLVADLGGLHDALDLTINFATGEVKVAGEQAPHTLYGSFESVYGEGSIPKGIFSDENDRTFADNTTHTLKMFYLERGHMASNLSLKFNIQPLPSPPVENDDPDGDPPDDDGNETDESFDLDSSENEVVEISVSDNTLLDSTEIPKTGDDSLIGWWAALCILSLVGIVATVCNLMIRKRRRDKQA